MFVSTAHAVEVSDLYQAKVVAASQAKQDRNNAIKNAMQAVLVKVGGEKSVLTNEIIKQGLRKYQQYLVQFSYQTTYQDNKSQLFLQALFNEEKINRLFHQANLPLWGNLRPQVLLWLVEEQGLNRRVISESSSTEFPKDVRSFSQQRGLPISLPLMDLTDLNALSTTDIWGRFNRPLAAASSRYHAEAFVVIRLSNSTLLETENNENEQTNSADAQQDDNHPLNSSIGGLSKHLAAKSSEINDESCDLLCRENSFALDWRLFSQSEQVAQSSTSNKYQGADKGLLIKQALADITQQIYQYYALNMNENKQLDIDVANVNSLERYMQVNHFLTNLSAVDSVKLIWAKGQIRRFRLTLLGSQRTLLASLKLNKQLKQYIDPLAEVDKNAIPVFYWQK